MMTLTQADVDAVVAAVWSRMIEGIGHDEMVRIMFAALAGRREGVGTSTEVYYAVDGVKPRITFTPDSNGNGTPVTDGTP